jgi:hypothetical protein
VTAALDMQHPAVLAMLADERRFDAGRPPCPPWCDATCETFGHCGDAIIHAQTAVAVESTADHPTEPLGAVHVRVLQYEHLGQQPDRWVEVDFTDAGTLLDVANFTPTQARALIRALTAAVDSIESGGGAR